MRHATWPPRLSQAQGKSSPTNFKLLLLISCCVQLKLRNLGLDLLLLLGRIGGFLRLSLLRGGCRYMLGRRHRCRCGCAAIRFHATVRNRSRCCNGREVLMCDGGHELVTCGFGASDPYGPRDVPSTGPQDVHRCTWESQCLLSHEQNALAQGNSTSRYNSGVGGCVSLQIRR